MINTRGLFIYGILTVLFVSFQIAYVLINQEKNKQDFLIVPEKPVDYWKDSGLKKNWYIKNNFHKTTTIESITYIQIETISNYIKEKEGFKSKAYRDGCLVKAKVCPQNKIRYSNGYGTLAKSKDEVITQVIAEQRLVQHIKTTIYPKLKDVKFKNKNQIIASIDFAYNIGHNAFVNNIVNSNNEIDCAKMTNYIIYNGKINEGLKKRRFENFIQCVSIN